MAGKVRLNYCNYGLPYYICLVFSYSAPFLPPFIIIYICSTLLWTPPRDTFAPAEYFLARLGIMTKYDRPYPLARLTTISVFAIRSSISIDASKQKVWDVLLDFASYKEWCVCPTIQLHHRPLSNQSLPLQRNP